MKNFVILALIWTATMFLMLNIVTPYAQGTPISLDTIIYNAPIWLVGIPIWLICGFVYTYTSENKKKKAQYEKLG